MFKRYKAAKRVLALLLCGCLVFGSVNQARFKSYAIVTEIIAGGAAIAGGLAIGYLLHMLGVTASSKEVYKSKETVIDWANEQVSRYKKWNAATKDAYKSDDLDKEFSAWTTNLRQGVLDKSSAVWKDFKKWVSDGVYKPNFKPSSVAGIGESIKAYNPANNCVTARDFVDSSVKSVFFAYTYRNDFYTGAFSEGRQKFKITMLEQGDSVVPAGNVTYYDLVKIYRAASGESYRYSTSTFAPMEAVPDDYVYPNYLGVVDSETDAFAIVAGWLASGTVPGYPAGTVDGSLKGGISDVYKKSNVLDNVDIVGGVDAPTAVGAVSVPIAWPVNEDTLVDTLGGVRDGSIPWDKTLSNVGTAAVDVVGGKTYVIGNEGVTTKEYVYAKDKADAKDEEITVPDVVAPSANLGAYTIAGLEKMFPFCLPFDLIDFIKVLDAPAEAPRFTIPFKYPTRGGMATYDIVIDLSSFNSVAELLRDMECLAFIVGLIMITRSRMIRG